MVKDGKPKGSNDNEAEALRKNVEAFLSERLQGKLDKLKEDDPKRDQLIEQFQLENWVGDAARRVSQLQLVTHSLKAIHPDAKGTSLYAPPHSLAQVRLVGTHCLPSDFAADVVGNAAALDVFKFLKLEHDGVSLLDRVLERDEALAAALSDKREQALEWIEAFASITESKKSEGSHTKAKQIYFLVGDDPTNDDHYHLLAPLYATSLAHYVFQKINADRFGEEAKLARQARRENKPSEHGYNDYPALAVQKLGGTKPQNISQLNSERGGQNYLLASLPPQWQSYSVKAPLNTDSAFSRFRYRPEVRHLLDSLLSFLKSDPPNTMETRDYRDELVSDLGAELLQFAAELRSLNPGWSESAECDLPESEKLWLDPGRAEWDPEFRMRLEAMEWRKEICDRFANWLNGHLVKALPVGDTEQKHWSSGVGKSEQWLRQSDDTRRWVEAIEELEQELEA